MDAIKGICYSLGVGIIVGIIPVMVGESIREDDKQYYRPEETEKGLIEKNYKSKFINNDMKTVKDIRNQIRRDVVNKIDKEK